MATFADLVASRKEWIAEDLIPWCRQASLVDLRRAEEEWLDIAGKIAPEFSLWLWAWSRFPALHEEGLRALNETHAVAVQLRSGERVVGFPDARRSKKGELVLEGTDRQYGPYRIDDVADVVRA